MLLAEAILDIDPWTQRGAITAVIGLLIWIVTKGIPNNSAATVTAMALIVAEYKARAELHKDELHKLREQMHAQAMSFAASTLQSEITKQLTNKIGA